MAAPGGDGVAPGGLKGAACAAAAADRPALGLVWSICLCVHGTASVT